MSNTYSLWEIVDFSNLKKEVVFPFLEKKNIVYGHFDPKSKNISKKREIPYNGKIIIEGVGLFHPEFDNYFTYKIRIDCPIDVAFKRGKYRDREEYCNPNDELWGETWKDKDLEYFEQYKPKKKADLVIDNSLQQAMAQKIYANV